MLPPVRLNAHYTVVGYFDVAPSTVNFGVVNATGQIVEETVIIKPVGSTATPSELHLVSSPKGVFVRTKKAPDGTTLAHITLRPSALPKSSVLNERIVLATGSKKQPKIVIPVTAISSQEKR